MSTRHRLADAALTLLACFRCRHTAAIATARLKLLASKTHVFHPPFGYYDRDYPGFVIDPVKAK